MGVKLSSEKDENEILNNTKHLKYYIPLNEKKKKKKKYLIIF